MESYRIRLCHQDRRDLYVERLVYRENNASAVDTAQRWLRLHRRTSPARKPFDAWAVIKIKGRTGLPTLVQTGGVDSGQSQRTGDGNPTHGRSVE